MRPCRSRNSAGARNSRSRLSMPVCGRRLLALALALALAPTAGRWGRARCGRSRRRALFRPGAVMEARTPRPCAEDDSGRPKSGAGRRGYPAEGTAESTDFFTPEGQAEQIDRLLATGKSPGRNPPRQAGNTRPGRWTTTSRPGPGTRRHADHPPGGDRTVRARLQGQVRLSSAAVFPDEYRRGHVWEWALAR